MKKLIFILLKIIEVILAFILVWFVIYKPFISHLIDWLINILGCYWVLILNNIVLLYCLVRLIRTGFFKAWFDSNKKWSQNIVNWSKRVRLK